MEEDLKSDVGASAAQYLDGAEHATLSVPLSLEAPDDAHVGFTASTSVASEKHDIRSFSFCQRAGCTAL